MPWKECSVMDERMQFMARRLDGEPMAELCREFGISRKTGYKIFDRYQECGIQGADRPEPPPLSLRQPTSLHPEREARARQLGGSRHRTLWVGLWVGNFGVRRVYRFFRGRSLERGTVKVDSSASSPFGKLVAERPKCCLGINLPHLCWAGHKGCHQTDFIGLGGYTL